MHQSTKQWDECDDLFRHAISGAAEKKQQRNDREDKQLTVGEIFGQVFENGANRPRKLYNGQCRTREKDIKDNVRGTNKSRRNREKQPGKPNSMRGKSLVGAWDDGRRINLRVAYACVLPSWNYPRQDDCDENDRA